MNQMKTLRRESKKLARKGSWKEIWFNLIDCFNSGYESYALGQYMMQ